jgi:hypothetical protein
MTWAAKGIVEPADQLVVVSGASLDTARTAMSTLDWLGSTSVGIEAHLPRFKSVPDDSVFCRAWHGWQRDCGRELLPGAERLGAFAVEAQAFGSKRRVVLATARKAP